MKPKYLFDKDHWMLAEHIPDIDIFFLQLFFYTFVNRGSYSFIKTYKKAIATFDKGFECNFFFGKKDSFDVAESILKALVEQPNFGKEVDKNIYIWSRKLIAYAQHVAKLPLENYSNKQLWNLYNEHHELHTKLYTYGWLPVSVDMFHNNFTNKLKSYLYSVCDSKYEAEKVFVIFTTPSKKTLVADERENFLNIYEKHKKFLESKNISEKLRKDLKSHAEKWGHLGYIYAGNVDPFEPEYYLKELLELAETGADGKKLLKKEQQQLGIAKFKQKKLYKKLKISSQYRGLFEIAQDFALSKLFRRHAQLIDLLLLHRTLLKEIALRLKVSRFQVQMMLRGEIRHALIENKLNRSDIVERLKHCVFYVERNFEKVYLKVREKKIRATLKIQVDKKITEISGQVAQPGYAKGVVKIIFRAKDMVKFNKGDILVSIATDPDIVPAMKKASAIVTEQGGITSHAAIVSRELGTPCIIGTKFATKVLHDGDLVEVDANKGIVKILKKAK